MRKERQKESPDSRLKNRKKEISYVKICERKNYMDEERKKERKKGKGKKEGRKEGRKEGKKEGRKNKEKRKKEKKGK